MSAAARRAPPLPRLLPPTAAEHPLGLPSCCTLPPPALRVRCLPHAAPLDPYLPDVAPPDPNDAASTDAAVCPPCVRLEPPGAAPPNAAAWPPPPPPQRRGAPDLPPGRGCHVPQHHPHQPLAAFVHRHRCATLPCPWPRVHRCPPALPCPALHQRTHSAPPARVHCDARPLLTACGPSAVALGAGRVCVTALAHPCWPHPCPPPACRRGLRRLRLQPPRQDLPAANGVGVARRDVCR